MTMDLLGWGRFLRAASGNPPPGGRMGMIVVVGGWQQQGVVEASRNLRGEDPWMNDLILDNLFSYCSRQTISNCRLVSRKWYSASLKAWMRSNSAIKLMCRRAPGGQGGDDEYDDRRNSPMRYMPDFVQLFGSGRNDHTSSGDINGMSKYKKFELQLDSCFSSSPEVRLNEFWSGNGAWITSLSLQYKGSLDLDLLKRVFYCHYTPNLEELDIRVIVTSVDLTNSSDDEDAIDTRSGAQPVRQLAPLFECKSNRLKWLKISGDVDSYPFDWKDYLGCCPKLENLKLRMGGHYLKSHLINILVAIKEIRAKNKNKLQLKSLGWCHTGNGLGITSRTFSSAVSQLLKESQLDLESFFVYDKDEPDALVREMLKIHHKSLTRLAFYWNTPLQVSPFLGVSMNHLTSLLAEGLTFGNLLFLRELPNLRSLVLVLCRMHTARFGGGNMNNNNIISATDPKEMEGVSLTSLACFRCDYKGNFQPNDLSRLHGWMPALLRLELQLDNETFPTVCQLWPNLKHLRILEGRVGDRGIVGLETRNGIPFISHPNIIDLQELQCLEITATYEHREVGDQKLTTYSVLRGLSKLPRLEKVTISPGAAPDDIELIETYIRQLMPKVDFKTCY